MTKHKIQNKFKFQIPNDKTFVLIFVIVILNLFCALNFDICHLSFGGQYILYAAEKSVDDTAMESDQQISEFSLAGYADKGKKSWDIKGETADIFDTVVKLKQVVGNMYGDTEKIKLTAQNGDFDKTEGKVHLEKDVVITTSSGAKMTTESLDWDRKNQLVTTKDKVDIQKESMTTTATGLRGNPNLSMLNFEKDVQVEIDPSKAANAKAGTPVDKIIITCDGPLEVDYEKNVAVFKNNVAVNNKDMQLYSDVMDIYFSKPEKSAVKSADPGASLMSSSIDKMIAKGNVKIVKGDNTSYSDEATYNSVDKRIVLTGRPKLVLSSTADLSGMFGAIK